MSAKEGGKGEGVGGNGGGHLLPVGSEAPQWDGMIWAVVERDRTLNENIRNSSIDRQSVVEVKGRREGWRFRAGAGIGGHGHG